MEGFETLHQTITTLIISSVISSVQIRHNLGQIWTGVHLLATSDLNLILYDYLTNNYPP